MIDTQQESRKVFEETYGSLTNGINESVPVEIEEEKFNLESLVARIIPAVVTLGHFIEPPYQAYALVLPDEKHKQTFKIKLQTMGEITDYVGGYIDSPDKLLRVVDNITVSCHTGDVVSDEEQDILSVIEIHEGKADIFLLKFHDLNFNFYDPPKYRSDLPLYKMSAQMLEKCYELLPHNDQEIDTIEKATKTFHALLGNILA